MSENRFYYIPHKGSIQPVPDAASALARLGSKGFIWLDFVNPAREELEALVEPLGIHTLSVDDCFDREQIPKIEDFPGNTFVIFNSYRYQDKILYMDELDFFLGRNFLVTVSPHDTGAKPPFRVMEESIRLNVENVRRGPDFLFHTLLDYTVDNKFAAIDALEEELDQAEESILKDPSAFRPRLLIKLRRHLLSLRKSLFHEREILVKICRKDSPFISEKSIYHFRDVYDHLSKFFEMSEMYREMISSLMEMYLSMINNRMNVLANRTNMVMRRLTLITTIFMPLTLLSGVLGMSEWSMMTGPENWKVSYPLFFLLICVMGLVNYFLLKWYEQRETDDCPGLEGCIDDDESAPPGAVRE
jgi:magnesium transporter